MPLKTAFMLSVLLAALKLGAYASSSSAIVLASFFDSFTDAAISYLNYIFFRKARESPDIEHPFGHGGLEVISGLLQGALIATLALLLCYDTISSLWHGRGHQTEFEQLPFSIAVMAFSAFGGLGIQTLLGRYEQKLHQSNQSSLSVSSDRAHYLGDFWTNGLGALGLLSVWWTRSEIWDQILGFMGGLLLLKTALPLLTSSLGHIMQSGVDPAIQSQLQSLICGADARILGVHRLRARRLGPTLFVDFHLKLPAQTSLRQAHDLGEATSAAIRQSYPAADVLVHLDPDDDPDEPEYDSRLGKT